MSNHPIHSIFVSQRKPAILALALDKANPTPKQRQAFARAKHIEENYARRLRKVARHIADVISRFEPGTQASANAISQILDRYANTLRPWAEAVASKMIAETEARNHREWMTVARRLGTGLEHELANAPTGEVIRARLADQVDLITSLPREAAERVHKLTLEGLTTGRRFTDIVAEIKRSGDVSASRATLIARTETSRTATELTRARALSVGSTHFTWRTVGDADVRPSHKKLNGKTFRWDDPPECDPGHHALPGGIWNCRCFAEPLLEDD